MVPPAALTAGLLVSAQYCFDAADKSNTPGALQGMDVRERRAARIGTCDRATRMSRSRIRLAFAATALMYAVALVATAFDAHSRVSVLPWLGLLLWISVSALIEAGLDVLVLQSADYHEILGVGDLSDGQR